MANRRGYQPVMKATGIPTTATRGNHSKRSILHRTLGLLHRHVGDIHTGYGHVGKNRASAAGPSARPDIGRGQHSNHSSGYDPGQLAPAFSFRLALSLHRSHLLLRSRFPGLRRAPFTCLFLKALLRQLLIL